MGMRIYFCFSTDQEILFEFFLRLLYRMFSDYLWLIKMIAILVLYQTLFLYVLCT
jgi:hypothetical protein